MLTYGIFLFFSIFPIIHPKGLAQMPEGNMENTELLPLGVEQKNDEAEHPSFDLCLGENLVSPLVAQHRQWLKSIRHETPNPKTPFKVAVYIRFFNQTKYRDEEYLERNKEVFRATLSQYPMWEFVGFYIDNGSTAPYMENSTAWSELLSDCDAGKVDLIITQKVSNVSRDAQEILIRTTPIFHPLLAVISNRQNRRKALKSLGLLRNQNHPKLSSFIRCYP